MTRCVFVPRLKLCLWILVAGSMLVGSENDNSTTDSKEEIQLPLLLNTTNWQPSAESLILHQCSAGYVWDPFINKCRLKA